MPLAPQMGLALAAKSPDESVFGGGEHARHDRRPLVGVMGGGLLEGLFDLLAVGV